MFSLNLKSDRFFVWIRGTIKLSNCQKFSYNFWGWDCFLIWISFILIKLEWLFYCSRMTEDLIKWSIKLFGWGTVMCIISVVVGCAVIVMIMFENEPVHQNNLSPRLITSPISITSIFYPDPLLVLCSTPLLSKSHRTQFSLHFFPFSHLFLPHSYISPPPPNIP